MFEKKQFVAAAASPPPTLFLLKRKVNYSSLRSWGAYGGGVAAVNSIPFKITRK